MSLFSFLRKNKQDTVPGNGEFQSRAEEESEALRGRGKHKNTAGDDPIDPVLPEKKRARRRLIGAIALVLAAVIGLPMVFDSEPKPLADDIDIQIPSKDKLAQSGSVRRAPPASPVVASAALDQSEQIVEPAAASDRPVRQIAAAAAGKPAQNKSAESTQADNKHEVKLEPKQEAKQEAKPAVEAKPVERKAASKNEPKTSPKASEEERARAILEDRAAPKGESAKSADEKKSGKYAVQVAALRTPDKINELRGKLKQAGIETYTQKVATESGESTRIRVGPFASKEEADRMTAKLAKLGFSGKVVP